MAAAARGAMAATSSLLARRAGGRVAATAAGLGGRRGLASLADNEVAINILAAPVTAADLAGASKGTEGVGVVTAVGAKVKSVAVNDWIVAASPAVGTFAKSATAKEADVAKVPSDIPVEYAANFHAALTARQLLQGLTCGDVVVQADADGTVGLAVVQIAKAKGIATVNILADGPNYHERAGLVKDLGGDVVVTDAYAASNPGFGKILAELPKPKAAFAESSKSGAAAAKAAGGAKLTAYGEAGGFFKAAGSAAERAAAIEEVGAMFREGTLHVWVERHPFEDKAVALAEAKEPFKTRRVVLVMGEAPRPSLGDLGKLSQDFEAAFQKLRMG